MLKRTIVLHPWFKGQPNARQPEACLEEGVRLAEAIELEIVDTIIVSLAQPRPSTLLGKGKVEEVKRYIKDAEANLVIINQALTPVQQRNLEKEWGCKVIDRTALILEIFGARARTHEGILQVELAALNYQKSRLVRSWTHLERQRGGFGFLGGPGESQIEIDRRLIRERISKIKRQLENVVRTRELHRKTRRDVPYPVVALVGYTNAGKSTLFNRLTGASVLSMDKLFATLDPTMRGLTLPDGIKVILSDTVGFVSDLPTELVAAFRATLEEVLESDVMIHVRDISHPDSEAQKRDVEQVLKKLFATELLPNSLIEVYNKVDLLSPEIRRSLAEKDRIGISAITGEGIDMLLADVEAYIQKRFYQQTSYRLSAADGKSLAWLHAHGKVLEQVLEDEYIHITVRLSPENIHRFEQLQHARPS